MTKNKETIVLALSLLVTSAIAVGGYCFLNKSCLAPLSTSNSGSNNQQSQESVSDRISFGEKTLLTRQVPPIKKAAIEAIASGDNNAAISRLEAARQSYPSDPEILIFLNNGKIGTQKSYTIAVSLPISNDTDGSLEILRGVAQAQEGINRSGGMNGTKLKVAIANDDNDPEIAKQIAAELVARPDILGVVGPYASDVTLAAAKTYEAGNLVAISPISTSVKLSNYSPYIFRTVPSDYVAARALADYMLNSLKSQNAAVFFNSQSSYSQSLKNEFVTAVSLGGGQVSNEYDLSAPDFRAAKSVDDAIKQGARVIMLAANTGTLDRAMQVVQLNRKRLALLGGDDLYAPKTLELSGDLGTNMVVAVAWDIDTQPNSNFVLTSKQLWKGEVNWRTATSYDATQALIGAIAKNPTRTGVQQALSAPDFSIPGASAPVRFLKSGDRNAKVELVKVVANPKAESGFDFVPIK